MTANQPAPQRSTSELLELLTERDLLILKDLEQFRLLTTRQLQRLRFTRHTSISSATRTTVRVLDRIENHGLITRLPRRIGGAVRGSAANIWQLTSTGERLLRRLSGAENRRRYVEPSAQFTAHTLAIADTAIEVIEAAENGQLELLELQTEPDCWRTFTGKAGQPSWLRPDLYLVTADRDYESHWFIEIDRGTEHLPAVLRKCETYHRYWQTGTEQAIHDVFPAVLWIVPDDHRATKLRDGIRDHPTLPAELFQITTTEGAMHVIAPESNPTKGGTP